MCEKSLQGKTALITGSAKRMGRETALALADHGVNVVIHYRSSKLEAYELSQELIKRGVQAWTIKADFADPKVHEKLVEQAIHKVGTLDVLINNASIFPKSNLDNVSLDDVQLNLKVNAWAPFALSRAFAKHAKKGKIVNFLDAKIEGYVWEHVAYYLSKHMLAVLTRMCAFHFAPHITVNAVAPGLILPPKGKDGSYLEERKDQVPLQSFGSASEVTQAVLFLLESEFITGQIIHVDGGEHLTK